MSDTAIIDVIVSASIVGVYIGLLLVFFGGKSVG